MIKYRASAKLIKLVRNQLNLSHEQIGKMLGKDRTTIVNYEAGRINMPGDIVFVLQKLLYPENKKGSIGKE